MYPKLEHGDRVVCKIGRTPIDDAKISIDEDGRVYICQNSAAGLGLPDKMGYKNAWLIGYLDEPHILANGVTDFKVIERADGMPVFNEGEVILDDGGKERKVLAVYGCCFLASESDDKEAAYAWYLFKEAHRFGWKRKEKILVKQIEQNDISQG